VEAQQLGVPAHHGAHLSERGQGRHLLAREGGREIAEDPRPAEAAAANHDARCTGLLDHAQGVRRLPDVAVAQHRDLDVLDEPGDRLPVGPTRVGLADRAPVQGDRGTA
jgi:hypothetical protein